MAENSSIAPLEFGFMETVPVGPSRAEIRQAEIDAWKERGGVRTLRSGGVIEPWLACAFTPALIDFDGYLGPDDKANLWSLYSAICGLIDDAGMSATADTEEEACQKLATQMRYVAP